MKALFVLILLNASMVFAGGVDDVFAPGNEEFKFERLSNDGILLAIDKDAKIACLPSGLCTLSSGQSDSKGWDISFNVSQGGSINSNGGTTIITGGYDPNASSSTGNNLHWGITLSYRVGHCTQRVLVPRSLYYSMNRYLYGLLQETGETRKGFTPADEAMIMFYSTIMKQASAASCSAGK